MTLYYNTAVVVSGASLLQVDDVCLALQRAIDPIDIPATLGHGAVSRRFIRHVSPLNEKSPRPLRGAGC